MPSKGERKRRRRTSSARCSDDDILIFNDIMAFKEDGNIERCTDMLKKAYASEDSNSDLRAQACYELALLNCQMGNHRDADIFLRRLGYRYKLSKNIWEYDVSEPLSSVLKQSAGAPGTVSCHDNVLPPQLLHRLCTVFSADSPFWSEHEYPTDDFFSYNVPLFVPKSSTEENCYSNLMQQLGHYLQPLVSATFPDLPVEEATSMEWWAHTRTNGASAGHRLHYDLDEVSLQERGELSEEVHPFVSSVLYLDDGGSSGAPTLVTNHSVLQNVYIDECGSRSDSNSNDEDEGEVKEMAWLCPPKTNRLLLFDGSLMHGVVPHLKKDTSLAGSKSPRVTLMIGWWGPHVTTTDSPTIRQSPRRDQATLSNLKPNMAMPLTQTNTSLTWPQGRKKKRPAPDAPLRWPALLEMDSEITKLIEVKHGELLAEVHPSRELIEIEGDLWEEVPENTITDLQDKIETEVDFLGNWFVRSRSEILDAVERTCMECRLRKSESVTEGAVEWISVEELNRLRGD